MEFVHKEEIGQLYLTYVRVYVAGSNFTNICICMLQQMQKALILFLSYEGESWFI